MTQAARIRIDSEHITARAYENAGAGLWRTGDIYVSENSTGTMWTVETPTGVRDFPTRRKAFDFADQED